MYKIVSSRPVSTADTLQSPPIFETPLFRLTILTDAHFPLIRVLYSNRLINRMTVPYTPLNREGAVTKLSRFQTLYQEDGLSCYAVYDKTKKQTIGIAGLTYVDSGHRQVEVNCALRRSVMGKGFGTKLWGVCIELAKSLGIKTLYAHTLSYNRASQQSLLKSGFHPDGIVEMPKSNPKDTYLLQFKYVLDASEIPYPSKPHPKTRRLRDVVLQDYRDWYPQKSRIHTLAALYRAYFYAAIG